MPVIRDFFDELQLSIKKVNDEVRQMFLFLHSHVPQTFSFPIMVRPTQLFH